MVEKSTDIKNIYFYDENNKIFLKDLEKTIVYFYPKSFTPGCTLEAKMFNDFYNKFKNKNWNIIGVSCDDFDLLKKFKEKYNLKFPLLKADCDVLEQLDVYKEKTVFGKKKKGIVRTTIIVDKGKILKRYNNVRVKEHVDEVYSFIKTLNLE